MQRRERSRVGRIWTRDEGRRTGGGREAYYCRPSVGGGAFDRTKEGQRVVDVPFMLAPGEDGRKVVRRKVCERKVIE